MFAIPEAVLIRQLSLNKKEKSYFVSHVSAKLKRRQEKKENSNFVSHVSAKLKRRKEKKLILINNSGSI